MDLSSLGNLGDLARQMQDAYKNGLGATDKVNEKIAKDSNPDHIIDLDIKIQAKVEGHDYKVDANVKFEIELKTIFEAAEHGAGDLSPLLDGLGVDLGDDKGAVMEQLGQPRAVGVVKDAKVKELILSNKDGKINTDINRKGNILATLNEEKLSFNCEGVFTYPDHTDAFIAIPSMEKMQEHMVVDLDKKDEEVKFSWTEDDKDGLKIEGMITLSEN